MKDPCSICKVLSWLIRLNTTTTKKTKTDQEVTIVKIKGQIVALKRKTRGNQALYPFHIKLCISDLLYNHRQPRTDPMVCCYSLSLVFLCNPVIIACVWVSKVKCPMIIQQLFRLSPSEYWVLVNILILAYC